MKKVEAIIRKSKFNEVVDALQAVEVNFFSYWDVTGVGNEKIGNVYRGITYSTKDIQRRCLSIVVSDSFVDTTVEAIIKSMTPKERSNPELLNGSRKIRIAKGSGTTVTEVNQLLKQFNQMRKMMKNMNKMGGAKLLSNIKK